MIVDGVSDSGRRLRGMHSAPDLDGIKRVWPAEKMKGAGKPTIAPTMTLQAIEREAAFLDCCPVRLLAAFLAAQMLARGTSGSRGPALPALE